MPKNLFGKLKPNQLMAMMQQEGQQPQASPYGLQPYGPWVPPMGQKPMGQAAQQQATPPQPRWDLMGQVPLGADGVPVQIPIRPKGMEVATPYDSGKPYVGGAKGMFPNDPPRPTPTLSGTIADMVKESGVTAEDAGGLLWRQALTGLSPIGAAGLVSKKLYDMANKPEVKTTNAPPAVPPSEPEAEPSDSGMKHALERGLGGDLGFGDTLNLVQALGKEAQSRTAKDQKLRADLEGTPELDEMIAKAQADLATAKSERKQPGLGEFLTLALMNLGNRDYRNNADMVLGTSQYMDKVRGLENFINSLEAKKASEKMSGRRQYQATKQRDRYSALEQMLQQQESARKQQNADRDFGFKNQKMGADKLMQRLGQYTDQMGTESDPAKRKALQDEIDRLDPYNKRRQQQQVPQDNRQSRMFGELLGGGGYA